jgi:hypothetical protein
MNEAATTIPPTSGGAVGRLSTERKSGRIRRGSTAPGVRPAKVLFSIDAHPGNLVRVFDTRATHVDLRPIGTGEHPRAHASTKGVGASKPNLRVIACAGSPRTGMRTFSWTSVTAQTWLTDGGQLEHRLLGAVTTRDLPLSAL